jgi:hypothetical protein
MASPKGAAALVLSGDDHALAIHAAEIDLFHADVKCLARLDSHGYDRVCHGGNGWERIPFTGVSDLSADGIEYTRDRPELNKADELVDWIADPDEFLNRAGAWWAAEESRQSIESPALSEARANTIDGNIGADDRAIIVTNVEGLRDPASVLANWLSSLLDWFIPTAGAALPYSNLGNSDPLLFFDYSTLTTGVPYAETPWNMGYQITYGADTQALASSNLATVDGVTGVVMGASVSRASKNPANGITPYFEVEYGGSRVFGTIEDDESLRTATLRDAKPFVPSATYRGEARESVRRTRGLSRTGHAVIADAGWALSVKPFASSSDLTCPCSVWTDADLTTNLAEADPSAVELGVKFRVGVDGSVHGIRFHKGEGNTGTHLGSLWTGNGVLLGAVEFVDETATGWQVANFSSPIPVSADTLYVASYFAPNGNYAGTPDFFADGGVDNGPLHLLGSDESGGNGVYLYGGTGFPSSSFRASNYWVDIVFEPGPVVDKTAPSVVTTLPADGAVEAGLATRVTATFSEPIDGSTINSASFELSGDPHVAAVVSYDSESQTAALVPKQNLEPAQTYTATLRGRTAGNGIRDLSSNALVSDFSWSFSTVQPGDTAPPVVTSKAPADRATDVGTSETASVTFDEDLDPTTVTNSSFELRIAGKTLVPAAVTIDAANRKVTLTPNSALALGTTYTAMLKAGNSGVRDLSGNPLTGASSWTFTTIIPDPIGCPCSLWDETDVPAHREAPDTSPVEVGLKFQSNHDGEILGIRFYKSSANTSTHLGSLWSSTGELLARAPFTDESASGWQTLLFAAPVEIAANTTYVASYHTNVGRYSVNPSYFAGTILSNGPLRALADGEEGGNGVYRYGASAFPSDTFESTNYWVDVIYRLPLDSTPPLPNHEVDACPRCK